MGHNTDNQTETNLLLESSQCEKSGILRTWTETGWCSGFGVDLEDPG